MGGSSSPRFVVVAEWCLVVDTMRSGATNVSSSAYISQQLLVYSKLCEAFMKNSRRCPKCDSKDIIRILGEAGANLNNHHVWAGFFKSAQVTRYLCGQCGFSEEWIDPRKIRRGRVTVSALIRRT
jgi:ribosomal protein S27AE